MGPMNENSGVIHLATLDQAEYWVDRYGAQHPLEAMTQSYLENVRGHLQKMASNLYVLELRRCSDLLFIAGFDPEKNLEALESFSHDSAEEWLNNTPLVKAITALLDGTN